MDQNFDNNLDLKKMNKLTINLSFDRERMNNFFYSRDISYADISKTRLVLFPILVERGNIYLFSDNYFFKNWNVGDKEKNNEFVEYILPVENLEDMLFIKNNKENLESIKPEEILSNYDIKNYLFLIVKISDEKINIFLKGTFSENNIVKNFDIYNPNSEDREGDLNVFIKKIKNEINEIRNLPSTIVNEKNISYFNSFLVLILLFLIIFLFWMIRHYGVNIFVLFNFYINEFYFNLKLIIGDLANIINKILN